MPHALFGAIEMCFTDGPIPRFDFLRVRIDRHMSHACTANTHSDRQTGCWKLISTSIEGKLWFTVSSQPTDSNVKGSYGFHKPLLRCLHNNSLTATLSSTVQPPCCVLCHWKTPSCANGRILSCASKQHMRSNMHRVDVISGLA